MKEGLTNANNNEDGNNPPKPQSSVNFGMRVRRNRGGFFCLFSCLLIFNLFNLQVIDEKGYAEQAEDQQLKDETIAPNRGVIYDTNMKVLARSATVVGCDCVHQRYGSLRHRYLYGGPKPQPDFGDG